MFARVPVRPTAAQLYFIDTALLARHRFIYISPLSNRTLRQPSDPFVRLPVDNVGHKLAHLTIRLLRRMELVVPVLHAVSI